MSSGVGSGVGVSEGVGLSVGASVSVPGGDGDRRSGAAGPVAGVSGEADGGCVSLGVGGSRYRSGRAPQ